MVAFDYFTQPQGPNIDISLFGDASAQGAQVGSLVPNPVTAAIQGAMKGYDIGLDWESKRQENEIRENQIEQLPLVNELQRQQTEQEQLETQAKKLALENQVQTNSEALDVAHKTLQTQSAMLDSKRAQAQQKAEFEANFGQQGADSDFSMLFGSKYNRYFTSNPNAYYGALTRYLQQHQRDSKPEQWNQVLQTRDDLAAVNQHAQTRTKNMPKWTQQINDFEISDIASDAVNSGFPNNDTFFGNSKKVQVGKYKIGSDGVFDTDSFGNLKEDPAFKTAPASADARFMIASRDPSNPRIWKALGNRDYLDKDLQTYTKAQAAWKQMNTPMPGDRQQFQPKAMPGESYGPVPEQTPPTVAPTQAAPRVKQEVGESQILSKLSEMESLKNLDFSDLVPDVKELDSILTEYQNNPIARRSLTLSSTKADAANALIYKIIKKEYDANPEMRDTFNEDRMKAENEAIDMLNRGITGFGITDWKAGYVHPHQVLPKFKTPFDVCLYFRKKQLLPLLDQIGRDLAKSRQQTLESIAAKYGANKLAAQFASP